MKDARKVCQFMERCDAHGRSVQEIGEVWQLSGSAICSHQGGVKGIRKVCQLSRGVMVMVEM